MKRVFTFPLLVFLLSCTFNLFATDYYVSALSGDNNNPGTLAQPFATIRRAASFTNPGDTVFIMNGTYTPISNFQQSIVTITRSGREGAYITYKAYPGHTPKLKLLTGLTFQIWRAIAIDASYIAISGLEIEGTNQLLNYADAYQTWRDYENRNADWNKISMYNCGSISIGNSADAHHIIISNCKIHDTGGGIGGFRCDYVTIENNLIYNTCWYSMYAGSGISILDPKSIDAVTSYKIFIRNNVVHNNKTLIPWERIDALSDGNGIILDVNTGNGTTTFPYVGRYLVENNVSYNNGGGGVHAYRASHVDIVNNTAYNNGTVVGYPEIDANQCSDVRIYNNIMYARTGGNCNGNDANTIYDYNLYFNGPSYKNGGNDMTANPQFISLATDSTANLQLNATSPAINNGSNIAGQFSVTDILGVGRPVGFASDKGAYEYPTVIARTELKLLQDTAEIFDNTGRFDFGDVSSSSPKTVTFTIQNIGDLALNLTGTPTVVVANTTGTGFSLATDAPATVAPNGSVTFQVTLTPTALAGNYAGTVSIANDDANENPYNFVITGYGYDGTKALQTITFNPLPIKVTGSPNFDPGATTSAGLPISYTSSNLGVATIVAGQIRIVAAGTSTITASQPGDTATNPARNVTQLLTVTPVLPPPGTNMISNPTFDVNTTGWTFANKNGGVSTIQSVPMTGSSTNVGNVVITTLPTPNNSDNIQLSTNVFLVKDRNYIITFKASADSARAIGLRILQNASPFATIFSRGVSITTTQATYGSYAYTSTYTGSVALRFFLGNSNKSVYLDDVFITEEAPVVVPSNQPPVVSIINPVNNSSFAAGTLIPVEATASDTDGFIRKVEFYYDGIKFFIDSTSPYIWPSHNEIEPGIYSVTAKAFDNSGDSTISDTVLVTVTGCTPTGVATGEGYTNIPGTQITDLTNNPAYPGNPGVTLPLGSLEYNEVGSNYGARLKGYICAPTTGNYIFYIAGDDQAGFFLSTDVNPSNKVLVAYNEAPVGFREWFQFPSQKSAPIRMIKGVRYYFEALHKQSTGSDHLSVGWTMADGTAEFPISGNRLSPIGESSARMSTQSFQQAMRELQLPATGKLVVKATPNPSDSYFTITTNSSSDKRLSVLLTDMQGRIMERKTNLSANGTLQLGSRLPAGIYILEVTQGSQKQRFKLIRR